MDDDFVRETSPSGDLVVPPRTPPTAVALIVPPSPDRHRRPAVGRRNRLTDVVERAFDVVDELADAVAEALNLRPTRT